MISNKSIQLIIILVAFIHFAHSKWVPLWADEFNGNSLNYSNWGHEEGGNGWGNNELEYYTKGRTENARVENGNLVINVKLENRGGKQFTSARLFSRHAWTYGKFEARIKAPAGKHLWPAFWMFPLDSKYGIWAASGEIDIMEIRGQKLNVNQGSIHYGGSWPNQAYSGSGEKTFPHDFSKDFHTFAFEWTQTDMKWFIDGAQFHQENINKMMWSGKGTNPYSKNGQPFDQPFKFIINIAVGGTFFPENIYGPQVTLQEAKQWPKPTMEIDYVRVFKWEN